MEVLGKRTALFGALLDETRAEAQELGAASRAWLHELEERVGQKVEAVAVDAGHMQTLEHEAVDAIPTVARNAARFGGGVGAGRAPLVVVQLRTQDLRLRRLLERLELAVDDEDDGGAGGNESDGSWEECVLDALEQLEELVCVAQVVLGEAAEE